MLGFFLKWKFPANNCNVFYDALVLYEVTNGIVVSSPSTKNSENIKCELRRAEKIAIKYYIMKSILTVDLLSLQER